MRLHCVATMMQHCVSLHNQHLFCCSWNVPESIPVTVQHSITWAQTKPHWTWGNTSESVNQRRGRHRWPSALYDISHVPSHFLAKSTDAGYLFLLTTHALHIKSQVPLRVSCPDHNQRHQAIPLAHQAMNKRKTSVGKHLTLTFFHSIFSSTWLEQAEIRQIKLHPNDCIFPISLSICLSLPGMSTVGGVWMIFEQLDWIQSALSAGSIQDNNFMEERTLWRSIGS